MTYELQVSAHKILEQVQDGTLMFGALNDEGKINPRFPRFWNTEAKQFVTSLVEESPKFFLGDYREIPEPNLDDIDFKTLRLPFPSTYFEILMGAQDKAPFRMCLVAQKYEYADDSQHMFDFYIIYKKELDYFHIMPYRFSIEHDDKTFKVNAHPLEPLVNRLEDHNTEINTILLEGRETLIKQGRFDTETEAVFEKAFNCDPFKAMPDGATSGVVNVAANVIRAVLSCLTIINCTNIKVVLNKPSPELNRSRTKKGKPPLCSFRTITIDKSLERCIFFHPSRKTGITLRMHMRRGHIKNKKYGKYWWNPHVVGRKNEDAQGTVIHDYDVKLK